MTNEEFIRRATPMRDHLNNLVTQAEVRDKGEEFTIIEEERTRRMLEKFHGMSLEERDNLISKLKALL
jgi:hypothetical protein